MSQMSDYLEDALRNWFKGTTFPTKTANSYVALYTAAPSDSGGGTEVSGNGYARQPIANADWTSGAAGTGSISNTNAVTFPAAVTANWGTITHLAIFDALTVGNMLLWNALTASKVVNVGDVLNFAAGSIVITFA